MTRSGHKFNAVRTEVDGITFASKAEARRYSELKLLEKAGAIMKLVIQPEFALHVYHGGGMVKVGKYVADFRYLDKRPQGWREVVEDVKGVKTPVYRLKKKMVEAEYGIEITEITR